MQSVNKDQLSSRASWTQTIIATVAAAAPILLSLFALYAKVESFASEIRAIEVSIVRIADNAIRSRDKARSDIVEIRQEFNQRLLVMADILVKLKECDNERTAP